LLWEKTRSEGRAWTIHSFDVIDRDGAALLQGATDVQDFCPQFYNLTYNQKVNFWAYLISAITKYESGFNPTSRYVETTMGTDPVTGQQVVSEGLLQLSYQDSRSYTFCNEFDWSVDKNLSPTDPAKSILNPQKNLTCGIRILNYQITKRKAIAIASGAYWAVIKSDSKYSKLTEIKALTTALAFCK
jgi:hypothetical protein